MGPEGFDVVGRAEGLQIRLRRSGEHFTQEFAIPGNRLPMIHCDGRDLHLSVDGADLWLPYSSIGVAQKAHGLCLQAFAKRPDFEVETILKLSPDRGVADATTTFVARRELRLSAVENVYHFIPTSGPFLETLRPDYAWLPNLKFGSDSIAGQHTFRSPCAIIQHGADMIAVIPCLAPFTMCSELPAALDYRGPDELRFGLVAQEPEGFGSFRRLLDRGRRMKPGESISYRYSLMLRGGLAERMGHRDVVRFLWARYGMKDCDTAVGPRTLLLDDYCRYAFDSLFERKRMWRTRNIAGRLCGGPATAAAPLAGNRVDGGVIAPDLAEWSASSFRERLAASWERLRGGAIDQILFLATANAARTAYGLAAFARRWSDPALRDASRQVATLVLSAPPTFRLFPAIYAGTGRRAFWSRGTKGSMACDEYHVPDSCETGVWLLADEELSRDPAVVNACRQMAQALLAAQAPSGEFSAWLAVGRGAEVVSRGTRNDGAATAAAGRFFLALYRVTGDADLLSAARKCGEFVMRHVQLSSRWDTDDAESGPVETSDGLGSGVPWQPNLPMYWASELLRGLYVQTNDERYRQDGLALLDALLLHQQIWDAPFLPAGTLGGFGVSNGDARWNDARTALFADLLFGWYEVTGQAEYFIRGLLALRAAFALMRLPAGSGAGVPSDVEEEYGMVHESCGLNGRDSSLTGYASFDWGAGSACAVAALTMGQYGDVYVDVPRRVAFALNGCRVRAASFEPGCVDLHLDPPDPYPEPKHRHPMDRRRIAAVLIKFRPAGEVPCRVRINEVDLGRHTAAELKTGLLWPSTRPVRTAVLEEPSAPPVGVEMVPGVRGDGVFGENAPPGEVTPGPERPADLDPDMEPLDSLDVITVRREVSTCIIDTAEGTLGSGDDEGHGEKGE